MVGGAPILALLLGTLPDGEGKEAKFAVNESGVAVANVRQAPTHRGMELRGAVQSVTQEYK